MIPPASPTPPADGPAPAPPAGSSTALPAAAPPDAAPPALPAADPPPSPASHQLPGRRGHLPLEALLATTLVFLLIGALALLPLGFHAFDPVKEVLKDFSYTDTYYSKISQEASADTSIVLVNIGRADRATLAALVQAVGAAQPRAIGLDAYFPARADSGTARLAAALAAQRQRLVTGEYLPQPASEAAHQGDHEPDVTPRVVGSAPALAPGLHGYLNFVGNDSLNTTVRYFRPFQEAGGQRQTGWSAQLLRLADPTAFADLQARHRPLEAIRYRGNLSRFVALEGSQLLAGQVPPATLRGKIVLMGFLGEPLGTYNSLEDLHFTPLNTEQLGRSLPDMYGLVIQANILSMMLHHDYISPTPYWLDVLLAFVFCYLHVLLFMYLQVNYGLWYHPISKVVQTLSAAVLVYSMVQLYVGAHLDLGVALAVVAVVLAVDALYLYEALAAWTYRRWGVRSYVVHVH